MKIQSIRHYAVAYEDIVCGKNMTFVLGTNFYTRKQCDAAVEHIKKTRPELMNPRSVFIESSYTVVEPDELRLKMEAQFDSDMSKKVGAQ